jgi:hypothetical protein
MIDIWIYPYETAKSHINYITSLGQKLWHGTVNNQKDKLSIQLNYTKNSEYQ